jgi:hypothetical protein
LQNDGVQILDAARQQPRSAEHIFREYLEGPSTKPQENSSPKAPAPGTDKNALSEYLWLVARCYYSSPREGDIFFRENNWPYRRIMRGCWRLLAPPISRSAE